MTFNYRVLKEQEFVHGQVHDLFKVITVYYDEDGNITSWADTSNNTLVWATYEDLEGTVGYVQSAFKKPVLQMTDGYLLPLSPEPEPPARQEIYVVEHRDWDFNQNPMYYASSWKKAVEWMDEHAKNPSRDNYYYAIYAQPLDGEADNYHDEVMLFDRQGEPMEGDNNE